MQWGLELDAANSAALLEALGDQEFAARPRAVPGSTRQMPLRTYVQKPTGYSRDEAVAQNPTDVRVSYVRLT